MAAKLCDSYKSATGTLFCRADPGFLCMGCDSKVHAANKLASRHARVWMCEVCEQAPASVTCKADAAVLCVTCDRDIHLANPLSCRQERFPVVPFYEPAAALKSTTSGGEDGYFSSLKDEDEDEDEEEEEEEEEEAASWLLPNPDLKVMDSPDLKSADYLLSDIYPYLDRYIISPDQKPHQQYSSGTDGVVPVQTKNVQQQPLPPSLVDGVPCYDVDFSVSKPFMYNLYASSLSQSVSSSSVEVGVVPDYNSMGDVENSFERNAPHNALPNKIFGMDREARVLRYREKRKNRKFEKTIRYASRKAYVEIRPRIKGRFTKRSEVELDGIYNSSPALIACDVGYGVAPSY